RVADLYREHFGALIVDEFQDLTPQQLRIVNRIGYRRTTYAGVGVVATAFLFRSVRLVGVCEANQPYQVLPALSDLFWECVGIPSSCIG
ncbi:MAG: UvrD-helicase domain-containing protein, partial [Cutibacterium sp.]|nr:UvrD-helicase domain-containing protein [Cutibacterium sp.]